MPIPASIHNLCDLLDKSTANHPDKIALRDREKIGCSQWTYLKMSNYVYSFARHLKKLNVDKNQTVGILIPNSKWWGLAFFASLACDAQVVPLDKEGFTYREGYLAAKLFVKAIQNTPEPLTRESFLTSFTSLSPDSLGSDLLLSIKDDKFMGLKKVYLTSYKNGKFIQIMEHTE